MGLSLCRVEAMRKEAAEGSADRARLGEDLAEARERLAAEEAAQVCCWGFLIFFVPPYLPKFVWMHLGPADMQGQAEPALRAVQSGCRPCWG